MTLPDFLILAIAVLCMCLCASPFLKSRARPPAPALPDEHSQSSWLFCGSRLKHATGNAFGVIKYEAYENDWQALYDFMKKRFFGFPEQPPQDGFQTILYPFDSRFGGRLKISTLDNHTQLEVVSQKAEVAQIHNDAVRAAAMSAPHPIWQQALSGEVIWHNHAYSTLFQKTYDTEPQAHTPLFDLTQNPEPPQEPQQFSLTPKDSASPLHFEVTKVNLSDSTLCYATDISNNLQSEKSKQQFIQTLSKSFSQLKTGVAIFNAAHELMIFNPACLSLTALPIEFLISKPDVLTFLDRLLENGMMPSSYNLSALRQKISALAAAPPDHSWQETWFLDNGQTYEITIQSSANGALSILFNDISDISQSMKRLRESLRMSQHIFDSLEYGAAVFSSNGKLQFHNQKYRDIWQIPAQSLLKETTISTSIDHWQKNARANPFLAKLQSHFQQNNTQTSWSFELPLISGETVTCHVKSIDTEFVLIGFQPYTKSPLHKHSSINQFTT